MKIKHVIRITILLICAFSLQAFAQSHFDVTRTFFSTTPELYEWYYRNVSYTVSFEYYAFIPPDQHHANGYSWTIKRIDPQPPFYPTPEWMSITGSNTSERYDSTYHCRVISGTEDWSFLFTEPGTFLFRSGAFIGLPIHYTNEELWNGIDHLVEYDTDTVTFDFGLPHIQEITLAQPCDWNWLPVIEGYIDETGLPNYDDFKVTLKAFFKTNDPPQSYKLRWVLQNISWYDGACMNYYADSTSLADSAESSESSGSTNPPRWNLADLMILGDYNPGYSCWYDTVRHAFLGQTNHKVDDGDTISIVVTSYDFGAHGDILIEAQGDSTNEWYNLTKYLRKDSTWVSYSTIPIDQDNPPYTKCGMADYWKALMVADTLCPDTITIISQIEATQDLDDYIHGVLACDLGDWLNTFEEYRGFYCQGVHTRTSPWRKDFFVYSDLVDSVSFFTGVGYATLIGPRLCHQIDSTEMNDYTVPEPHNPWNLTKANKSINWFHKRIDSHVNSACAVFLSNSWFDSTSQMIGLTKAPHGLNFLIPETTGVGYLYYYQIRFNSPPNRDTLIIDLPLDTLLQQTTAGHEIGHMVDFRHNENDSSIMHTPPSFSNPANEYDQTDYNWFLVKPRH